MKFLTKIFIVVLIQALIVVPAGIAIAEPNCTNASQHCLAAKLQIQQQAFTTIFHQASDILIRSAATSPASNAEAASQQTLTGKSVSAKNTPRALQAITIATMVLSAIFATGFGFQLINNPLHTPGVFFMQIALSATGFWLSLFPTNFILSTIWGITRHMKTIRADKELNNRNFANIPLAYSLNKDNAPPISIVIPIHTEPFDVIEETLDHARAAAMKYANETGSKVNIIVCEDGLNVLSNNNISEVYEQALLKTKKSRSKAEQEVLRRINYYNKHNISFTARPKPINGVAFTQRAGKFKKASNINHMFELHDKITQYQKKHGVTYIEAQKNIMKHQEYQYTLSQGSLAMGDFFLLLDKDSITHKDVLVKTVAEFLEDPSLAYTQHTTYPLKQGENYFTQIVGYFTENVFNLSIKIKALLGAQVPFVGHNAIIRTQAFNDAGRFHENRVSEDLHFSLTVYKQGLHGKYIAYKGLDFGEAITQTHHEESSKFYRYAYGVVEMVFNPFGTWREKGLVNNEFKSFMKSKDLSFWHKIDLLIYKTSYLNLALVLPANLIAIITAAPFDIAAGNFLKYFVLFNTLSVIINILARYKNKSLNITTQNSLIKTILYNQKLALGLGFSLLAMPIYIAKGFYDFFFADKKHFPVTRINEMKNPTFKDIVHDMREVNSLSALLAASGAISVGLASLFHGFSIATFTALYVFFVQLLVPYIFNPFLMSAIKTNITYAYLSIVAALNCLTFKLPAPEPAKQRIQMQAKSNNWEFTLKRRAFLKHAVTIGVVAYLSNFALPIKAKASQALSSFTTKAQVWLNNNRSAVSGLPFSFQIPSKNKQQILSTAKNVVQRVIWDKGVVIYDSALAQIFWAQQGDMESANNVTDTFWHDRLGRWQGIRAYYDGSPAHPFIYNNKRGTDISPHSMGKRGFILRLIHGDGAWPSQDPLTGAPAQWQDWQPISGDNAWAGVIGPLQTYYKKYGKKYNKDSKELKLAQEIARAALLLQTENGAIRMAPLGTWFEKEQSNTYLYDELSTENNLSWYAGFRMLYQITGKQEYKQAMDRIEPFLKEMFHPELNYFAQGAHLYTGQMMRNGQFATDCQSWAILTLGPAKIDAWFGAGTAYKMLQYTKQTSGAFDQQGELQGFDFSNYRPYRQSPIISYEWSAGATLAFKNAADYYQTQNSLQKANALIADFTTLNHNLVKGKIESESQAAYPYASGQGNWQNRKTGFGWSAPPEQVLSVASTVWMSFLEKGFNPMILGGSFLLAQNEADFKESAQTSSNIQYAAASVILTKTAQPAKTNILPLQPETSIRQKAFTHTKKLPQLSPNHIQSSVLEIETSI